MEFVGELIWGCPAEVNWLLLRRDAYELAGVKFSKYRNHFYTDPLDTDQVTRLSDHPWVRLAALGEGGHDPITIEEEEIPIPRKPGRPRKS